jgi:hypothetical protein
MASCISELVVTNDVEGAFFLVNLWLLSSDSGCTGFRMEASRHIFIKVVDSYLNINTANNRMELLLNLGSE